MGKETFVLIHGAWHGAWCWYNVETLLKQKGHKVISIDLPGHGTDKTDPKTIVLQTYVDKVISVLDTIPEEVILVGHSMGGITISEVAEQRPEKIKKLIYLSAFLIQNGHPLIETAQSDINSVAGQNLIPNPEAGYIDINRDCIEDAFYNESDEKYTTLASKLLVPEPIAPFVIPVQTSSEKFGNEKKYYIKTTHDKAISIEVQNQMLANVPVDKVFTMHCDHSSFFSKPEKLVCILSNIVKL